MALTIPTRSKSLEITFYCTVLHSPPLSRAAPLIYTETLCSGCTKICKVASALVSPLSRISLSRGSPTLPMKTISTSDVSVTPIVASYSSSSNSLTNPSMVLHVVCSFETAQVPIVAIEVQQGMAFSFTVDAFSPSPCLTTSSYSAGLSGSTGMPEWASFD